MLHTFHYIMCFSFLTNNSNEIISYVFVIINAFAFLHVTLFVRIYVIIYLNDLRNSYYYYYVMQISFSNILLIIML